MKEVEKAWGKEIWIANYDYCGKKLILNRGFRCSMHYHKNKDETFYILKGKVLMEVNNEKRIMLPGDSARITPGTKHRFTGLENSEIMEFSTHHEDSDSYREEGMLSGPVDLSMLKSPEEKRMKCLVTGGAGFIGSNLALELEKQGHEVIAADNLSFGNKGNLKGFRGKFMEIDVSHPFDINEKFDVIFHEAAISDPRFDDDNEMIRANVEGFKNIIQLALKNNAKLVYASTAGLYGNGPAPMKEGQKKELLSAYAKSKLMMDELAEKYFDKMHIVGLRYFNVFGPREAAKGRPASMIYHLGKQMKAGKRPRIFKLGEQKRDHIYIKDVVDATIKAVNAKKSGIYNVGTGIATSFNELIKILNDVLGTDFEPEYIDSPYEGSYQNNTQADTAKAEKFLGFKANYSLKQGIEDYKEWIK